MPNSKELYKENRQKLIALVETKLTGNIICTYVGSDYQSVCIKLKEKDLNWSDFLTIYFNIKDGRMEISHGSGAWQNSTAMQEMEAIEEMFSIARCLDTIKNELISISSKIETLYMTLNREAEDAKTATLQRAFDMIASNHKRANFKDVFSTVSNGSYVTLISVNGFKDDNITPDTYEIVICNKGKGRLNLYWGDNNISKANLKDSIDNFGYFIV